MILSGFYDLNYTTNLSNTAIFYKCIKLLVHKISQVILNLIGTSSFKIYTVSYSSSRFNKQRLPDCWLVKNSHTTPLSHSAFSELYWPPNECSTAIDSACQLSRRQLTACLYASTLPLDIASAFQIRARHSE